MLAPRMGGLDPRELARVGKPRQNPSETYLRWLQMKKLLFMKKLTSHCKNKVKVNFLMNNSYREDQYTVIFYISVWSEVAWEVDLFENTCFPEMSKS